MGSGCLRLILFRKGRATWSSPMSEGPGSRVVVGAVHTESIAPVGVEPARAAWSRNGKKRRWLTGINSFIAFTSVRKVEILPLRSWLARLFFMSPLVPLPATLQGFLLVSLPRFAAGSFLIPERCLSLGLRSASVSSRSELLELIGEEPGAPSVFGSGS